MSFFPSEQRFVGSFAVLPQDNLSTLSIEAVKAQFVLTLKRLDKNMQKQKKTNKNLFYFVFVGFILFS